MSSNRNVKDIKPKSNPKTYIVKKQKTPHKIVRRNKLMVDGFEIHKTFIISLLLLLFGLILITYGIAGPSLYLTWHAILGLFAILSGASMLLLFLFLLIYWLISREKIIEEKIIKLSYAFLGIIEIGIITAILFILKFAIKILS